jgi:hypothetical protein
MKVKLIPKTVRAKLLIDRYGDIGEVVDIKDGVLFSSDSGPWLRVQAADRFGRWVHKTMDSEFGVEILEE